MQMKVEYGKRLLDIAIEFEERRHLSVTVHPDARIRAKAPIGYEPEKMKAYLEKRAAWIARQIDYFEKFHPILPERLYESGETHYYLGRQYRLRIRPGEKGCVRLIGRFFEMELPEPGDSEKAKELMMGWYLTHAKILLERRVIQHLSYFLRRGATEPKLIFRRMKKRWGSCSENGVIMLNTELVKAPIHCVDYVIIHELCHLICPEHDQKFYRLLGRVLPDWEKRKERLERVIL